MVEAVLVAQGWGEDDVDDAALVITEIVQNAIEHGSRAKGDESVHISCAVQSESIEIEVDDPGTGRDPKEAMERDPSQPIPLDATRGRGLFLIHRLCVTFERSIRDGGGMRVRVRRDCTPS